MRHFLIAGNTRVGSTWLVAALNSLPSFSCLGEARWLMPYQEGRPRVHAYIDASHRSLKSLLNQRLPHPGRSIVAIGSKLKLDPYGFLAARAIDTLERLTDRDLRFVLLRRSYFDIFATWKAYGIRHYANPAMRDRHLLRRNSTSIANFYQDYSGTPIARRLVLEGATIESERDFAYPVSEAVEDMLVLFYNDLVFLRMMGKCDAAKHLRYEDIRARFVEIAGWLAPSIDARFAGVIDDVHVQKVERDGDQLVRPQNGLRAVSDYLDGLFDRALAGDILIRQIVRHEGNVVTFLLPGLASICRDHQETRGLFSRWQRWFGQERWRSTRQVFEPVAHVSRPSEAAR